MKSRAALRIFLPTFICLFSAGFGSHIFALSLEELIGHEQISTLLSGEKPVLAQFKDPLPQLIPRNEVLRRLIENVRRDLDPSVMVETLHAYEKPQSAKKEIWSDEEEARLYNATLALSTLAGLQYFSESRGSMRTFYETSQVIDGPSTKRPLSDPVYLRPPAELTVFARQKDLTFGDNIYQYDFYSASGALIFNQRNLSSFYYGIIPVVGKEKLCSTVAILDAEEYILVYITSMAKAASVPGMKDRMKDSFANRAEALYKWFTDQANKAYIKAHL